ARQSGRLGPGVYRSARGSSPPTGAAVAYAPVARRGPRPQRKLEHDCPRAVDDHTIFEVERECTRKHHPLHVSTDTFEVSLALAVIGARHVLIDDRPTVELRRHVVSRRPDQLHAALARSSVWIRASEGGEEGVMNVDHRHAELAEQLAAENLH